MNCTNCGSKVTPDIKFCGHCGHAVHHVRQANTTQTTEQKEALITGEPVHQAQPALIPHLKLASSSKRLMNLILDFILYAIIFAFPLGYSIGFILGYLGLYNQELFDDKTFGSLFHCFVYASYYFLFEVLCQKTPAKFLTRTKVVNLAGDKPSVSQILYRSLARFIPFEPFSFSGSFPVGWHDKLSGTRVVG